MLFKKYKKIFLSILVLLLLMSSCKSDYKNNNKNDIQVKDISYANSLGYTNEVYIKENNEFIPYIVITDNYDSSNNTLLLRKKPLKDKMKFYDDNSSLNYYPESQIDKYLNNEFINAFSDNIKSSIVNTKIEVTSKDTLNRDSYTRKTEFVRRKIFLLSAAEYGITNNMCAKEGKKINGLSNYLSSDICWLRTPYLWESYTFWVISDNKQGSEYEDKSKYVYPAFTLPSDTIVSCDYSSFGGDNRFLIK